jgi:hypothetical protein
MTVRHVFAAVLAAVSLGWSGTAFAQLDHLHCYKAKDSAAKAVYTADLDALTASTGCQITLPAKMLCVETTKSNVLPAPPGGGPSGTPAGTFACYKVKCPKAEIADENVTDQFGSHTFTKIKSKLVCAPATPAGPTTTTTTTTLPELPNLVISEFLADPSSLSDVDGEYFEIYNAGAEAVDMLGLTVGNGATSMLITSSLVVAPADYVVFGRTISAAGGAVDATFSFSLVNVSGTIQVLSGETVIDQVTYSATTNGASTEVGAAFLNPVDNDNEANRCTAISLFDGIDFGTPGAGPSCTP